MTVLTWILLLTAAPVLAATIYLLSLTLLSAKPAVPTYRSLRWTFDILVPAKDEAHGIASTVASLRDLDYPRDRFRVIVVADNCTDRTACVAREAGALVIERFDEERRGKGHALAYGIEVSRREDFASAIVIVDADTIVSPNLLRAFSAHLDRGADVLQARYGVRNPHASWRTELMAISLAAFHDVRSRGREWMQVSSGLRGNGMCLSTQVLDEVPYDAFSLVEDLELGIRLGERGYRVEYVDEASVYGEMVSGEKASRSQRARWEKGRATMRQEHARRLLSEGLRTADPLRLDLALDLLVPPISTLATASLLGLFLSVAAAFAGLASSVSVVAWALSLACLFAYAARGWSLSETGSRGLRALAHVPVFLAWKLFLPLLRGTPGGTTWVRTARESEAK